MNVLLIHHCETWGGAGVSLKVCIEMRLEGGHTVTVCYPHEETGVVANLKKIQGNISLISCEEEIGMISAYNGGPESTSKTFWRNLTKIRSSRRKIVSILESDKFDLVVINSITTSWICKLTHKKKIPSLVYVRETMPKHNKLGFKMVHHYIDKYATGVVFISEFDKGQMQFNTGKQHVFRNCIHIDAYQTKVSREEACGKFSLDASMVNFLFLGGSNELKGYSVLTEAMKQISSPVLNLVIAGIMEEGKQVDDARIHYLGMVFDMPLLFKACDALVFPSTSAHQARPAFEAGALGLPVIISDFPETAETVRNDYNGLVFIPCDSTALAEKMLLLCNNQSVRETLGKNNLENTLCLHNYDRTQKEFNKFVQELVVSENQR